MFAGTLRQFLKTLGRTPVIWLAVAVLAAGTNLVDLVYGAGSMGALQIASYAVRILAIYWLVAVALRRLMRQPEKAWGFDLGIVFLIVWILVLDVAEQVLGVAFSTGASVALRALAVVQRDLIVATALAAVVLGTMIGDLVALRLAPWVVAKTTRMRTVTFGKAWRAMRGKWRAAAGAYLVLVWPLFVIHLGLTAVVQFGVVAQSARLYWAIGDGVESAVFIAMAIGLYAAVARAALDREAAQ